MKKLIAILALVFSVPAAAQVECDVQSIHWIHSKRVEPYTILPLTGPNPFTWVTETFPYTIPTGYLLLIRSMSIGSKFTGNYRASMLVLDNVSSVPDAVGTVTFDPPVILPYWMPIPVKASLINNTDEVQWMNSQISGYLVKMLPGITVGNAYRCIR